MRLLLVLAAARAQHHGWTPAFVEGLRQMAGALGRANATDAPAVLRGAWDPKRRVARGEGMAPADLRKAAAQWAGRPLPRRTIVGEPTSLQPVRGHKGHLGIAIVVGGLGGHTGFPNRGVNAIERAMPVLEGLRDLRQSMVEERLDASDLFPETPFPVLTVAGIEGGSAINVMPESCVIRVGVRLLPGQSAEEFLPRLRSAIEGRGIGVDMRSGDLESPLPMAARDECLVIDLNNTPSYAIDSDADFLAEVADLVGDHGSHGANFGTDAGRLVGLGCESVVFGPGNIGVAHKPDEWMPLDEFARTPELLRRLIR